MTKNRFNIGDTVYLICKVGSNKTEMSYIGEEVENVTICKIEGGDVLRMDWKLNSKESNNHTNHKFILSRSYEHLKWVCIPEKYRISSVQIIATEKQPNIKYNFDRIVTHEGVVFYYDGCREEDLFYNITEAKSECDKRNSSLIDASIESRSTTLI